MTAPADVDRWLGRAPSRPFTNFSRGILAETFRPVIAGSGAVLTSQAMMGAILDLYASDVVTGIVVCVTQAGSGTAPTSVTAGLLDLSGNRLAVTGELKADASVTGATGMNSAAFTAPYTVVASGSYYPVILENGAYGTNTLQLLRVVGGTGAGSALGSNAASGVTQTGRTTIANPATLAATDTYFYLGVY